MKCRACDALLSDFEASRKSVETTDITEGKKHYKRGFIVDFNDVNQFKETLNYYKKNKESINQIQKNAMEYFMNEASVNANAKKLLHILNNKNESI